MPDRVFQKGEVIGERFTLSQPLGKGAFGAVWEATDGERDDARVAIKILFERFVRDKKMLARFVQEAKILERLEHNCISRPIAWNSEGTDVYLAMEFIDGETLDLKFEGNARENSPIPPQGVAWICDQLCSAITYAHSKDVVHRDLKPKNVMVNRRGSRPFLKVLDFGIAKMLVGSEIDPTTVGRVLGSVLYISPEQVLGKPLDHRADIFSLGTILFELITLKRAWARNDQERPLPFNEPIGGGETNSHVRVLRRIAREGRPKATQERKGISPIVDEVLDRAMSINPEDRFDSAEELAQSLRRALLDPEASVTGLPSSPTRSERPAKPIAALPSFKKEEPKEKPAEEPKEKPAEEPKEKPAEVSVTPVEPAPDPSPTTTFPPNMELPPEQQQQLLAHQQQQPVPLITQAPQTKSPMVLGLVFGLLAVLVVVAAYFLLGS